MRRFDHLHASPLRLRALLDDLRLDVAKRTAAIACVAGIVLVGGAASFEHLRVEHDRATLQRVDDDLTDAERSVTRLRAATGSLERLMSVARAIDAIRRSGTEHAQILASLGEALPDAVWLTSVEERDETLVIEGRAASYEALGAALRRLTSTSAPGSVRLISSRSGSARDGRLVDFEVQVGKPT